MNTKTVGEVFQTRRDLLKLGGLGLLGASAESIWPLNIAAASRFATVSAATLIDAAGLRRSALAGASSIAITSGASITRTRLRSASG